MIEPAVAEESESEAGSDTAFPPIWDFIGADCFGFAFLFVIFTVSRVQQPELFAHSARALDAWVGLVNTLILLTSSAFVARAMVSARAGDMALTRRRLIAGLTIGLGFGLLKTGEYAVKIAQGVTPLTNEFFSFYFALTGIHFVHYAVGIGVLAVMISIAGRADGVDRRGLLWIESGAIYWHIVDILWLFLFPMIYLVSGR